MTPAAVSRFAHTYAGPELHGQVVQELGLRIVGGTYAQGAALPREAALCEQLGVSRTAVREAIKVLGAKGLLEARPRVGTRIRPQRDWHLLDPDVLAWKSRTRADHAFLLHLTEVREIIEPGAAALAARKRDAAQLAVMTRAYEDMGDARDIDEWVAADLRFHRAILEASANPLLAPFGHLIASALETLLDVTARAARGFKDGLPAHGKVLAAIEAGDAQEARTRMAVLVSDTRHLIEKYRF